MSAGGGAARRLLVAGNWKMNHSHLEAIQVVRKLNLRLHESGAARRVDVSIHPAFVALRSVQTVLESEESPIALGAQDCHTEDAGAFTGEVSAAMLAKLNCASVIVGHSERRALFSESDSVVRAKAQAVLRHGMTPLACVGETLEIREAGGTIDHVTRQVHALLGGLPAVALQRIVLAYEPIWAIGTGRTATAEDAQEVCSVIRSVVDKQAGSPVAASLRILYGGSVKAGNAGELTSQPDVDGLLVGGASLDPDEFAQVVSGADSSC